MNLVNISLNGNRITGSIPREYANISTLEQLVVEFNLLAGTIPRELGDLPNLKRLVVTSNKLTGELPENLGRLTTLEDFRISDNNFTGSIPKFIENWTNIKILAMQASGLTGPIPTSLVSLTKLKDLRISDLNGNESTVPPLSGFNFMEILILRSCNIVGTLPSGLLKNLLILDLSFNRLNGSIPRSPVVPSKAYVYLTGNFLSGPLPDWALEPARQTMDVSYNNLTLGSISNCQQNSLNLFASSKGNSTGIVSCLRSIPCKRKYYSLHINCGGRKVATGKSTIYEEDTYTGVTSFFKGEPNWALSSTGHFLDNRAINFRYTLQNNSKIIGQNSQLYTDARISPLSMTYYGFCLRNGGYTVHLHFAEIKFTDDRTYYSLGRRIFDVYVQGKLVLKDFNIEKEAGGVNRPIIKNFSTVVTDSTLDIRFYWAGKGTTALPNKGVYGPLISAISVISNDKQPSEHGYRTRAIEILVGVTFAILVGLGILWWKNRLNRKNTLEDDLRGLNLQTGSFTLRQIKAATNNFDPANKIGEGGFGPVYKGLLSDGTIIAVKQLASKSNQGNREFINEIGMISALQHPHLVKLYGCFIEGNQLLLVYEYMENNSLARALFGREEHLLDMDWPTRRKICIGIARGLTYLHEESRLKIVHRDIKATNVLLDTNLSPKISDFGLAKLDEEDNTHMSTRIAGTFGYMAPEYAMRGHLTDKADVYSFGVVVLEIVSGRSNNSIRPMAERFYLLDWANSLKNNGDLMELVDPRLESTYNKEEVLTTINVALLCTNVVATERPNMSTVVSILEGKVCAEEFVSDSSVSTDQMKLKKVVPNDKSESESMDMPWTSSSTSARDLYPITVDTEFWEKRDM